MITNTVCIRCGKVRIESKSWTEYIGTSLVSYTQTVCPDAECQKIVDEQLKKKRDSITAIQTASKKRMENIRKTKRLNRKLKKTR